MCAIQVAACAACARAACAFHPWAPAARPARGERGRKSRLGGGGGAEAAVRRRRRREVEHRVAMMTASAGGMGHFGGDDRSLCTRGCARRQRGPGKGAQHSGQARGRAGRSRRGDGGASRSPGRGPAAAPASGRGRAAWRTGRSSWPQTRPEAGGVRGASSYCWNPCGMDGHKHHLLNYLPACFGFRILLDFKALRQHCPLASPQ